MHSYSPTAIKYHMNKEKPAVLFVFYFLLWVFLCLFLCCLVVVLSFFLFFPLVVFFVCSFFLSFFFFLSCFLFLPFPLQHPSKEVISPPKVSQKTKHSVFVLLCLWVAVWVCGFRFGLFIRLRYVNRYCDMLSTIDF